MMKSQAIITSLFAAAAHLVESLSTTTDRVPPSVTSRVIRSSRDYHLLEVLPHDTSSFTQGLTYFDGHLYEGTGLEQKSCLLRHDPSNEMRTLDKIPLTPSHLFGEGISHYYIWKTDEHGNRIKEHRLIQLTWKDQIGKIYSVPELQLLEEFTFDTVTGEGWGITFVSHRSEFYVSDGSEYFMVWDAETLKEKRRIAVTFEREEGVSHVKYLNELEFVDFASDNGVEETDENQCVESSTENPPFTPSMKILANVWYQDVLISIDPESGKVSRVYDMRDLFPLEQRQKEGSDCLNGISVTGASDKGLEVWVTGKLWPKMYRIRLID